MSTGISARASRIRGYLDANGLRYSWVAERLGITPSHMTRVMNGERPLTADMAAQMADMFGVPVETFLPVKDGGEGNG